MPEPNRHMTVLVVASDELVHAFVAGAIGGRADIVEATDVQTALELLRGGATRFDLAFVDCILPGRGGSPGGLDVVRAARAQAPPLPVIAVTGNGAPDTIIEAFRSGASDMLTKPLDLADLLSSVVRVTARGGSDRRPQHWSTAVRRAVTCIERNYGRALTRSSLAAVAGMSPSHFSRRFRSVMGVSFRDFVCTVRLERAEEAITRSSASLTDIALTCGFYDLPHLDKAFRKRFGISPIESRRRQRWGGRRQRQTTSP
jgi:AraC-like DNA-binding protein